jgi:hypothetical protein
MKSNGREIRNAVIELAAAGLVAGQRRMAIAQYQAGQIAAVKVAA